MLASIIGIWLQGLQLPARSARIKKSKQGEKMKVVYNEDNQTLEIRSDHGILVKGGIPTIEVKGEKIPVIDFFRQGVATAR